MARLSAWRGPLATMLVVLLPPAALDLWDHLFHPGTSLPAFLLTFSLAVIAVYLGLSLRPRRRPVPWLFWLSRDLLIALLAASAGWLTTILLRRQGGGPVDPALLAVFTAYLLAVWPGVG
ncbi:MAG: hypothetical protein M0Z53_13830 [Thermaerobacter sp.]|nr:hypothetical protein [Thermaerobacter sp.]